MKTYSFAPMLLAAAMVSIGCKHRPDSVADIPPWRSPYVAETGPGNTLSSGEQPIPLPTNWTPETMDQDRDALAADTVHFAFDSAVIRDSELDNLKSVASALRVNPTLKLLVEGNCDERGTEEYNRSLGERRALSAREAMAKFGVDPLRIATISYGKDKPADPAHSAAAWTQNRRDDFVLLHPRAATNSNPASEEP